MSLPHLTLITNSAHHYAKEDQFLARFLRDYFLVEVVSPHQAPQALLTAERCLIRNAWPADIFAKEFREIERLIKERGILAYNPLHRRGYLEDKTYLLELFRGGFPVIPTINDITDLAQLGETTQYVVKPLDGCSSRGVRILYAKDLTKRPLKGQLIQPLVDLIDEISLFFIDNKFHYALVSAGPGRRWNLVEYQPTKVEIAWAQRFVEWNQLPYGLQRIDACRLKTGDLLLVEIEDQMPLLSLDRLSSDTRKRVCRRFAESLCLNLNPSPNKPS